jgi:hypothetical protein
VMVVLGAQASPPAAEPSTNIGVESWRQQRQTWRRGRLRS